MRICSSLKGIPPVTVISSSICPMESSAVFLIELYTVSPIPRDALIMTVLSMSPKTIRLVWAGLRPILRTPIFAIIGLRSTPTVTRVAVIPKEKMIAHAMESVDSPNNSCMIYYIKKLAVRCY